MKKLRYLKTISGGTLSKGTYFIGTAAAPMSRLYTEKGLAFYFTCGSANASTSFEPVLFHTVMTQAAQVGGRVRVTMESNVKLGGWANAFKALVNWKTVGGVSGLGSAICAEMVMPGGACPGGTYGVMELELVCPASWTGGQPVSFIYAEASGATKANFDTYGYIMDIAGLTVASGKVFQQNNNTASHALRIRVAGTAYYILLSDTSD